MAGSSSSRGQIIRSGIFATVSALLALMGHAVGSGDRPDLSEVLVPSLAIGAIVASLLTTRASGRPIRIRTANGRQRPARGRPHSGFLEILTLLAVVQLAYHLLFTLTAHPQHAASLNLPRMLIFHAVAAVLSALVLSRGEAAMTRLQGAVGGWLLRVSAVAPSRPAVDVCIAWIALARIDSVPGESRLLASTTSRRGPPFRLR